MTGRLSEYLGQGLVADRPVTPNIQVGGLAWYQATDEDKMYFWDSSAWVEFVPSSGGVSFAPLVTDTTTSRTLVTAGAGSYIRFTNVATKTVTIPTNATDAIPIGSEYNIRNAGTASLTIAPAVGVTINNPSGGTRVLENKMTVTLKKVAIDEWDLIGQTVAV